MKKNDEELRFKINVRSAEIDEEKDEMILEGYAAVFEQPTVLFTDDRGNEYKEVITKGAFDNASTDGCFLKFNHDNSVLPLARVRGGSMVLESDDYGLHFRAKLFDTSYSRDVYEIVKAGGIDECSFAFSLNEAGAEYDKNTRTRRINAVEHLWDCAIVENPAYGGTSVKSRSFFEAEAEKERLENLEREKQLELAKAKYEFTNLERSK